MKAVILRRDEIYAAVWEKALSTVASSYGISDVALRKICKKLNIPFPPRGYWARLAAGRKVKVPPLPKLKPGEVSEHRLIRPRYSPRIEAPIEKKIIVPEVLDKPHRLIQSSLPLLRRSAKTMSRAASTESCLDIVASKECLDRALRIMDTVLKALEAHSYMVEVAKPGSSRHGGSQSTPSETRVLVNGEWITFSLDEKHEKASDLADRGRSGGRREIAQKGSGKVALRVLNAPWSSGLRQSWSDGQKQRVEDCLGSFIANVSIISASLKAERYERERREQEWAEARKRQEEIQKRDEIERQLRYDSHNRAADWAEARKLETFLNAFEEDVLSRVDLSGELLVTRKQWLGWAWGYISQLRRAALEFLEVRAPLEPEPRYQAWTRRTQLTVEDVTSYLSIFQVDDSGVQEIISTTAQAQE